MFDLEADREEIIYLGKRRHRKAREKGRNPLDQNGYVKTVKRDIFGVRGEFTACRALGLNPESIRKTSNGDPDKGWDGIYKGWKYEVKDTDHPSGRLAYQPASNAFEQDIWILSVPYEKSNDDSDHVFSCDMRIGGWIWRIDMSGLWESCFFNPTAWCIEQSQLNSFDDLLNIQAKPAVGSFF